MRLQKKRSIEATSTVPPLLLATTIQVRSGTSRAAAVVMRELVGGVEHVELRRAVGDAVDRSQHFGAEAAAAHAEQVDRFDAAPRAPRGRAPRGDRGAAPSSCRRRASRAASAMDFAAAELRLGAPHRDVALPDAGDDLFVQQPVGELGGGFVGKSHAGSTIVDRVASQPDVRTPDGVGQRPSWQSGSRGTDHAACCHRAAAADNRGRRPGLRRLIG